MRVHPHSITSCPISPVYDIECGPLDKWGSFISFMAPRWGDREGERDSIINTVESGEWPNQHTLSWRRTETLICIFSLIIFKVHIPILLRFLKNSMWQVVLCTARSVGAECGKENFKAAIFHTCPIQNCIQIKTFASECVKVWLQQQPPGRVDICILYAGP